MMKRKSLLSKVMLLLCLLIAGVSSAWGDDTFTKVTSTNDLEIGGEYLVVYESGKKAMGVINSNKRGEGVLVTLSSSTITLPASSSANVLTLGGEKDAYTLLGSQDEKYIGWDSSTNFASSATVGSNKYKWKITFSSNNVLIRNLSDNTRLIRFYGSNSDFRAYTTSNGLDIQLYKKKQLTVTSLSIGTAPTKTKYKVGETLDLTGLILDADGEDVTSGYTASPANGATLAAAGTQTVTITYGGKTVNQTIYVGELTGIAVTTAPTKTVYNEGQSFDPAGMVVTATYNTGDGHSWTETVEDYTYPSDALTTSDINVTISYGGQSTTQAITVNSGVPYRVTFNAGTGSCATANLDEESVGAGVTLPTATIGVSGWTFAGWAEESITNTEEAPTLYEAGETYNPTDNTTLYAVYEFLVGTKDEFIRATTLASVKAASKVILVNGGKTLTTDLSAKDALSESESKVTAADKTVFTLSGNDTDGYVLSGPSGKIGASSLPTSNGNNQAIELTNTNSTWSIVENTNTSNTFTFLNKGGSNVGLEYYSSVSKWVVFKTNNPAANSYYSTKVYIPNFAISYNSNPAAIINPTVAFTTSGDKALYVKDESSYTNVANVTGISKTAVYTSSDATVATVDADGVVTALKSGSTTITATVEAEAGVNTEATATYTVTVKDAKSIAGIKAITDASSVTSFTADLTDAVVTYVKDDHAYIQDASGAIYASCGSSLTAGDKINGAVSGSVKAAYKIDEITAINLTEATVTDGVVPAAEVKTLDQIKKAGTEYEGKLVTVNAATVTAALNTGSASGGKISDDAKTTEMNLYAPDENIEALKDAEGSFTGFISIYNGSTYRLNVYEQSQISFTLNAPTAQPLTFAEDAIELDEETSAFDAFTGQTVSGAQGTVTYSIDSDDDDVVTSINASTGAIVLSGNMGTATITATAAAKEVTEAGVTTPYTETEKSYTITVRPRYTVTFSVNGVETELREDSYGAGVVVPANPAAVGDFKFQGWSTATVAKTDIKPALASIEAGDTYMPTDDETIYAVFANEEGSPLVEHTSTLTMAVASAPSSPYVSDGSSWTWSNVDFTTTDNKACISSSNGRVTFTLPEGGKAVSLTITRTGNSWAGAASVVLKDESNHTLETFSLGSNASATYNFTSTYDHAASYTLSNTSSKNAWVDHIDFEYTTGGTIYSNYTTSLNETVAISSAGLATYASDYDLDYTDVEGIEAYIAKEDAGAVKLYQVNKVPANTGVLLRSTNSGTEFVVPVATTTDDVTGNKFVRGAGATVASEDGGNYNYILNIVNEVLGFYKANGQTVATNRAYLQTTVSSARIALNFDDETTGIETVNNVQCSMFNGQCFDLQGRKVNAPTKGLYIVDGKKVVIK